MSTKCNRREFFRTGSALAGAAIFTPYLFSSEQPERKKGPNDRLTIGAIGVSQYRPGVWDHEEAFDGRGTVDARNAAQYGEMVAAADVYLPHVEKFASYFPGIQTFQDYREIIDDPTVDVVTIGTPDHWHAKIAIEAMKAGKAVYVEKPLTLTMEECRKLAKVSRETGAIVQVGSQQRTENSTFVKAAAICRTGRLGKIKSAYCSCPTNESVGHRGVFEDKTPFRSEPVPDGLDWNFWLGQAPWVEYCPERCFYNFRWWRDYSGGEITNWGAHNVDIATWMMDICDQSPVEISGTGTFPNIENWYDVAMSFDVTVRYADGKMIQIVSGINEVIITGERGRIRANRGRLTGKPVEELTQKDEEELNEKIAEMMNGKATGDHMKNFFECVADGTQPVSDILSTVNGMNVCHMANICLETGKTLHWNQEKYEFDEPEATAKIARSPRPGFEINA
ncbi:MAG: Gfo/Idh/MocA family oxidoreductase [Thermoguttaceae bacterium]|nr:Gfo/Idh/MocA family oxidoreductase [Thermoguttaceae bacterium]